MPETLTKRIRASPNWKQIESLYLEGFLPEEIARKTGIQPNTISVGLCKRGITKIKQQAILRETSADVDALSRTTRAKIAAESERIVDKLSNYDPKRPETLNLHADTLQKAAKTAALVHGWGESGSVAIIVPGLFTGKPDQDVLEVESTTETD